MGAAADRDGAAAGEGEAAKLARYPAVADAGLEAVVPFAVETFGAFGPAAEKLLAHCARMRHNRLGPEVGTASFTTRSFKTYWRQRLALGLQRTIGRGMEARALEDFVP